MSATPIFDEKAWSPPVAVQGSAEREEFLMHYVPLVKVLVLRVSARLPKGLDVPDLMGEGVLGLIDAVNRFDPRRGIPFGAYARRRIRGAILDRLRESDPLSRSARDRDDRIRAISGDVNEPKSQEEIAEALGIPVKRLQRSQRAPVIFSIDGASAGQNAGGDERASAGVELREPEGDDPLAALIAREREALVRKSVADLPDREKQLMSLYYVEELTMKEVGEVLGVTESRVCQIHRRALARVKKKLRSLMDERAAATQGAGR
ncbi:MAG TPA: FliA/WhiG family RNA polymerase sigma factor [Verrucomicrobiae bacterium]|nr:FliA/WhiG family RNA polymerase sigma factor [Verrucomicrobiae bacterium]